MDGQALPVHDNPGLTVKEPVTGVRFHARMHALARANELGQTLPGCSRPAACETATAPQPVHLNVGPTSAVTLLLDCATSYRYPGPDNTPMRLVRGQPDAMRSAVSRNLAAAARRPYSELRTRHIADHQRLFRRAEISLGPDTNASVPTDQRVRRVKQVARILRSCRSISS